MTDVSLSMCGMNATNSFSQKQGSHVLSSWTIARSSSPHGQFYCRYILAPVFSMFRQASQTV